MESKYALPTEELKEQLRIAKAGVDGWARAHRESLFAFQREHSKKMEEDEKQAKQLKDEKEDVEEAAVALEKLLQKQKIELEQLMKDLKVLKEKEERLPEIIDMVTSEIEAQEALNANERTKLENEDFVKQQKVKAMEQVRKKYRAILGLEFHHPASDEFRIVFDKVDNKSPGRQFSLTLKVGTSYSVMECIPELPAIDQLIEEVNKSNNFAQFVRDVRKAFIELC